MVSLEKLSDTALDELIEMAMNERERREEEAWSNLVEVIKNYVSRYKIISIAPNGITTCRITEKSQFPFTGVVEP